MAVPGPTTQPASRAELVTALITAVRSGVLSRAQADQYLAKFDSGQTGTAPMGPVGPTAGGSLPGDQSAGMGGIPRSDVFELEPRDEGTQQRIQQKFGGVSPAYQKGISDLAGNKYWDWLLTRHSMPADLQGGGVEDWQGFLNREMQGGNMAGGEGRQAGSGDIGWLSNLVGQATGPDQLSDPISNYLWNIFQVNPSTGRANLGNIQDVLQGVVGSGIPQWLQKSTFDVMGNKLAQFQALDPRKTGSEILNYARGLGLPF